MPIEFDTFEAATENDLRKPTNGEIVVRFLLEHRDKAFTPVEIAEQTAVKRSSIGTVLSRLEDRGLVQHKGAYWAIGDEDAVREAYEFRRFLDDLDNRFGDEDLDKWREYAAQSEE